MVRPIVMSLHPRRRNWKGSCQRDKLRKSRSVMHRSPFGNARNLFPSSMTPLLFISFSYKCQRYEDLTICSSGKPQVEAWIRSQVTDAISQIVGREFCAALVQLLICEPASAQPRCLLWVVPCIRWCIYEVVGPYSIVSQA